MGLVAKLTLNFLNTMNPVVLFIGHCKSGTSTLYLKYLFISSIVLSNLGFVGAYGADLSACTQPRAWNTPLQNGGNYASQDQCNTELAILNRQCQQAINPTCLESENNCWLQVIAPGKAGHFECTHTTANAVAWDNATSSWVQTQSVKWYIKGQCEPTQAVCVRNAGNEFKEINKEHFSCVHTDNAKKCKGACSILCKGIWEIGGINGCGVTSRVEAASDYLLNKAEEAFNDNFNLPPYRQGNAPPTCCRVEDGDIEPPIENRACASTFQYIKDYKCVDGKENKSIIINITYGSECRCHLVVPRN